jgi:NAD+--asparagine ADP-ribosyltransferase
MWEALDRFLKTAELNGLMVTDFKEFQHSTLERHMRQDEEMHSKMTKAEFFLKIKEVKDKLNEKIRTQVKTLE